ncbi:MAG: hypothetical protein A3G18_01005 [Rhodospirillales bacterium RIFCSPLOWO2_12_FULL_58_28]|nr:MAG: hypothetical protein A3H92_04210 [Rhodospirillales bacterium RIFCSPLOWO2_02_FULL_58_16]OHC77984.1 MAG: hypothetical protein A3G18_01005 [Rhodospirillales bacterium RIFCSPLOWO2_12_FULL_58_28]
MTYALAIHGGVITLRDFDYAEQNAHLGELIVKGQEALEAGYTAINVVSMVVHRFESSGLYGAGKGSSANEDGVVEMDAAVMDGATRRAGAVAAVRQIANPVVAARAVMEDGRQVMLAGDGADSFARSQGIETISDPAAFFIKKHEAAGTDRKSPETGHGTVGAVALDRHGNLAAATSTGGTPLKRWGRVGDSPFIGAGTWADDLVAVSCSGAGEYFIRTCASHTVSARMRYEKVGLETAAAATMEEITRLGGAGGMIAVDRWGNITMPHNCQGMRRAAVSSDIPPMVLFFDPEQ